MTALVGRQFANLVLTIPGLGALAITTSVQSSLHGRTLFGPADDIGDREPELMPPMAFQSVGGENNSVLSG